MQQNASYALPTMLGLALTATLVAATVSSLVAEEDIPRGDEVSTEDVKSRPMETWQSGPRSIEELRADIRVHTEGAIPEDASKELFTSPINGPPVPMTHSWSPVGFAWVPTNFATWPLYFEDIALERYGHSLAPVFQPVISGVHFMGAFPLLPVQIMIDPPRTCVYTLGYYRPGSPHPSRIRHWPRHTAAPPVPPALPFLKEARD